MNFDPKPFQKSGTFFSIENNHYYQLKGDSVPKIIQTKVTTSKKKSLEYVFPQLSLHPSSEELTSPLKRKWSELDKSKEENALQKSENVINQIPRKEQGSNKFLKIELKLPANENTLHQAKMVINEKSLPTLPHEIIKEIFKLLKSHKLASLSILSKAWYDFSTNEILRLINSNPKQSLTEIGFKKIEDTAPFIAKWSDKIECLNFESFEVKNKMFETIIGNKSRKFSCLKSITISNSKWLSKTGLNKIENISSLESLVLKNCRKIAGSLDFLKNLPHLRFLDLNSLCCENDLNDIEKTSSLEKLILNCSNIDYQDIAQLVKKLENLKKLGLFECKFTTEEVDSLRKIRPNLELLISKN